MKRNLCLAVLALSCLCMAAAVPPAAADDPPLANFYGVCVSPRLCAVDAEASSDDGYITNYHWSWGDGTSTNGTKSDPTHTYASAGTYTITLTITDNANQTDFYSRQFVVPN